MNSQLLKKARQLQNEMMQTQREIEETEFTANCGPVSLVMLGNKTVVRVKIEADFTIDGSEDLELLEDSFVAASNQISTEIDRFTEEKMSKYKSMLGGFGGF